jgi:hypothetical protein
MPRKTAVLTTEFLERHENACLIGEALRRLPGLANYAAGMGGSDCSYLQRYAAARDIKLSFWDVVIAKARDAWLRVYSSVYRAHRRLALDMSSRPNLSPAVQPASTEAA